MPSYVTPKRATEYIFYISLVSQANTKIFQANPTIAAGDFKVSIDGGAEANPATLPAVTPASSKRVKITLSIAEMTGDNITVTCSDASGAEWCDLTINIQTSVRQIDDLATQTSVDTIDNFLDTEIAAILAAVDTEVGAIITTLGTPAGASVSADIAAIEAQTDDIGVAGAGLTAIPTVALVTTVTNLTNAPTAGDLTATMKTSVNTEVVDVLNVDTYAETSGVPAGTATLVSKISRLYDALIDKLTTTASKKQFFNNAGVVQWEKDLSDDSVTYTETTGNAP